MLNNKKIILILALILFFGSLAFWIYGKIYTGAGGATGQIAPEEGANFSLEEQEADYLDDRQGFEIPAEIGEDDYIYVQGIGGTIKIRNFYKEAVAIIEDSQVVLYRSDKFDVDYLRTSSEFVLTINSNPLKDRLGEAGEYLVGKLGVGTADLCKLKFIIVPVDEISSNERYGTLPLCSSVLE